MSNQIKLDKDKTDFVTDVGIGSFIFAMPGQAKPNQNNAASMTYSIELSGDICNPGSQLVQAVSYVAQMCDPLANQINPATGRPMWERHVYGPTGKLKRLEEHMGRDLSKYQYAAGKYVVNFYKNVSMKQCGMGNADINDPATKAKFIQAVAGFAPKVVKYANPLNPADVQRILEMNQDRQLKGLPPILEHEYHKTRIPVLPHEIWPGCNVRVVGHAYWEGTFKKTVSLALDMILLVSEGPRLAAIERSEDCLDAFAPAADLAPTAPTSANGYLQPAPSMYGHSAPLEALPPAKPTPLPPTGTGGFDWSKA